MADRYRKRPVETEAVQWRGNNFAEVAALLQLTPDDVDTDTVYDTPGDPLLFATEDGSGLVMRTVHGENAVARTGDWVIPEPVPGRGYPCRADIFAATYEPVPAEPAPDGGPETLHFIGLIRGLHATAHLTATAADGRINRSDGRGPWEPIHAGDTPTWFRVPREIAERWTDDDPDDDLDDELFADDLDTSP